MTRSTVSDCTNGVTPCTFTLPNGLSIPAQTGLENWNGSITYPTTNYENWLYPPISKFSFMFWHYDMGPLTDNGSTLTGYRAVEGVMYWCVQAYKASVKNNTLSSEVVASWYPAKIDPNSTVITLSPPEQEWKALGLSTATYFTADTSGYSFINNSLDINYTLVDPPNQLEVLTKLMIDDLPSSFNSIASSMSNRMRGSVCNLTVDG